MKRPSTPETQFLSAQAAACVLDHEAQTRIKSDVQGLRRVRDDFALATSFLSLAA